MPTFTITIDLFDIDIHGTEEVIWGTVTNDAGEHIISIPLPAGIDDAAWPRQVAEAVQAEGFNLAGELTESRGEASATVTRTP